MNIGWQRLFNGEIGGRPVRLSTYRDDEECVTYYLVNTVQSCTESKSGAFRGNRATGSDSLEPGIELDIEATSLDQLFNELMRHAFSALDAREIVRYIGAEL